MIVLKFGGTSVSSKSQILAICQIVKVQLNKNPVVVVSALSGVTDLLLSLPKLPKSKQNLEISRLKKLHETLIYDLFNPQDALEVYQFVNKKIAEIKQIKLSLDKKILDQLSSFGEILSSYIVAKALQQKVVNATPVLATRLIVTNDNFGAADFILGPTKRQVKKILNPLVLAQKVPVVTGYIGATKDKQITTLGRGGSDYSASIIGFCLAALEIQIWTDVDGIFSADPRLVKKARSLRAVSFKEAAELATFGAKVLHPRTIHPAIQSGIPVRVLNTFNPKGRGTLIVGKTTRSKRIKAISFKKKIILVNIYSTDMLLQKGFLAKIFNTFTKFNISVDLVSVSEVSISVTLDNMENLAAARLELSKFSNVSVAEDLGMVSLIGEGITDSRHNISQIFAILEKGKILAKMVSLGATNINISIIVKSKQVEKAVKLLHSKLLQL